MSNLIFTFLLFTVLTVVSNTGYASDCGAAEKYLSKYQEIYKADSKWKSLPATGVIMGFHLSNSNRNLLFGFSEAELNGYGTKIDKCDGYENLFVITDSTKEFTTEENPINMLFTSTICAESPIDPIEKVVCLSKKGIVFLNSPSGMLEIVPPDMMAQLMFHEAFHAFQIESGWKMPMVNDDFPKECLSNLQFQALINAELPLWKMLVPEMRNSGLSKIHPLISEILRLRTEFEKVNPSCLQTLKEFERMEGTASYFQMNLAITSGQLSPQQNWYDELENFLETDFDHKKDFYYGTGRWQSEILDLIDPSQSWQSKVPGGTHLLDIIKTQLPQNRR